MMNLLLNKTKRNSESTYKELIHVTWKTTWESKEL